MSNTDRQILAWSILSEAHLSRTVSRDVSHTGHLTRSMLSDFNKKLG